MLNKLKCFLGIHDWETRVYWMKGGYAAGPQCTRCNLWHKTTIRRPWDEVFNPGIEDNKDDK